MLITDVNGLLIQVTDLKRAIEDAEVFSTYCNEHMDDTGIGGTIKKYWQDYLKKLQDLDTRISSKTKRSKIS